MKIRMCYLQWPNERWWGLNGFWIVFIVQTITTKFDCDHSSNTGSSSARLIFFSGITGVSGIVLNRVSNTFFRIASVWPLCWIVFLRTFFGEWCILAGNTYKIRLFVRNIFTIYGKRRNAILGLLFGRLASILFVNVVEADNDVRFCMRCVAVLLEYITFDLDCIFCSFWDCSSTESSIVTDCGGDDGWRRGRFSWFGIQINLWASWL